MKGLKQCPRCGHNDAMGHNEESYEDGIHKEAWCDNCGWTTIEIVEPASGQIIKAEHNEGFGIASISGSEGAISVFFEKPLTKEEALHIHAELKAGYSGSVVFEKLTFWNGSILEQLI